MNFQDLLAKMKHLDEAPAIEPKDELQGGAGASDECEPTSTPADALFGERSMEECGMPGMDNMPHGMMGAPKQSDNVSMNVSLNGQGAGGVRDLMNILHNIEQGTGHAHSEPDHGAEDDILVGIGEEQDDGGFQDATTEPDPETQDVDAVTRTGNDIHSQGGEAEKVNGGGNPLGVSEALLARLSSMYTEIKESR